MRHGFEVYCWLGIRWLRRKYALRGLDKVSRGVGKKWEWWFGFPFGEKEKKKNRIRCGRCGFGRRSAKGGHPHMSCGGAQIGGQECPPHMRCSRTKSLGGASSGFGGFFFAILWGGGGFEGAEEAR